PAAGRGRIASGLPRPVPPGGGNGPMSRPLLRRRCLFVLFLALPLRSPALGQAPQPSFNDGTHVFRRLLQDRGFKPLKSFKEIREANRTLVIMLGDLDVLGMIPQRAEPLMGVPRRNVSPGENVISFVNAGGALLLASDRRPAFS